MKNRAFTLVEIVLALGLVGFSMLAIFALVAQGQKTSREARLEGVASLLAGKINSQLRASSAWERPLPNYTADNTLSGIAAGSVVTLTNYLDLDLANVDPDSKDRQFAVTTELRPMSSNLLASGNAEVAEAISRLEPAASTVFLNIEISYPAQAPASTRSKRSFASIITRTSSN